MKLCLYGSKAEKLEWIDEYSDYEVIYICNVLGHILQRCKDEARVFYILIFVFDIANVNKLRN